MVHRLPPEWETHTQVSQAPQQSRWALPVQDRVRSTDPCPGAQCGFRGNSQQPFLRSDQRSGAPTAGRKPVSAPPFPPTGEEEA